MEAMNITGDCISDMFEDVQLVGDYAVIIKRVDLREDGDFEYPPAPEGISMSIPQSDGYSTPDFKPVADEAMRLLGSFADRDDPVGDIFYGNEMYDEGNRTPYSDIPRLISEYEREDCAAEVVREALKAGYWIRKVELYSTNVRDRRLVCPECDNADFSFGNAHRIGFAWMTPEDLQTYYGGDAKAAEEALGKVVEKMNDYDDGLFDVYELHAAPVVEDRETSIYVGDNDVERITDALYGDDELRDALNEITPEDVRHALDAGVLIDSFGRQEPSMRM